LNEIVNFLVESIGSLGYIGIFILMFLESSFFPFPSEVVMIPAGYLASKGEMNLLLAIFFAILGSVAGAWFNYLIASKLGRSFLEKFISKEKIKKLDDFFQKHGAISTFSGRLIPGVRQYISFPAGLAKMHPVIFTIYTAIGAGIWVSILAFLGYYIGENEELLKRYLKEITIGLLLVLGVIVYVYIKLKRR
jgi:membrane protein DedA with SNARE-associated domain